MKRLLLSLCLLLLPALAGAYPYDLRLSAALKGQFETALSSAPSGRALLKRLRQAGPGYGRLRVLVRRDPANCFAWFSPDDNAVYFNSRFILKFFEAKKFKDREVVEILWDNKEVRDTFVKFAHPVYLHELVHALQAALYPEYRRDAGANPLEFEYEAYLEEDIYVHERMKADPVLLRDYIKGDYTDIYTENAFGSYMALSLDSGKYKDKIRRYYEEGLGGYVSLEKAEREKAGNVADSKILAYASGSVKDYEKEGESYERLKKQKRDYAAYLDGFYRGRWPEFSSDALLFIGTIALEEKNYPLALDCLAVADANSAGAGLPAGTLMHLKTRGALAVLEAASLIRDGGGKMGLEVLSQHLRSLDRACAATGRPFPGDLAALKAATCPKAMAFYAGKYAAETDGAKKDYYKESLDYFSACAGPSGGVNLFP